MLPGVGDQNRSMMMLLWKATAECAKPRRLTRENGRAYSGVRLRDISQ